MELQKLKMTNYELKMKNYVATFQVAVVSLRLANFWR